jgi:Predicted redox protein, regulator of disulfide bond formation
VNRLDLTGLKCPLPALMTKRALKKEPSGTVLEVIADDPLAYIDIPHMCDREGFAVIETHRDGDVVRLRVRRN